CILFNAELTTIQPAWEFGNVHYGFVSGASIGYCLKYMSKRATAGWRDGDDRLKEFALMSKGIGKGYLTDEMISWHLADLDNRMYVNLEGGKIASMPRYYRERIYDKYKLDRVQFFNKIR